MFTDASDSGLRASLNGNSAFGLWNSVTAHQSINYLRSLAVLHAPHSFRLLLQTSGHVVQVMPTAANINHQEVLTQSYQPDKFLGELFPQSRDNHRSFPSSWGEQQEDLLSRMYSHLEWNLSTVFRLLDGM